MNNYPTSYESTLTLKDGREIRIRPIQGADRDLLAELFGKMSPRSRYLRFMSNVQELPAALLDILTSLDYDTRLALAGVVDEGGRDAVIAVARYSHDPDSGIADLAVAVRDDWQHLGIGKALLAKVIDAGRDHGITRFGSMMDPGNQAMMQVIRELGYRANFRFRDGAYEVEIVF